MGELIGDGGEEIGVLVLVGGGGEWDEGDGDYDVVCDGGEDDWNDV